MRLWRLLAVAAAVGGRRKVKGVVGYVACLRRDSDAAARLRLRIDYICFYYFFLVKMNILFVELAICFI